MPVGATRLPDLEQAASHMPFDQFGRYHMLREAVDACRAPLGLQRLRILDVGGFYDDHGTPTLPLNQFLPYDDLTVLDVVDCDLPGYVKGDGTALHFDDASFDLVVSADTLEHIPRPQREQFWCELLRVARHGVILLAPFDTSGVAAAEDVLFEYIKVELHAEHQQLKEHREYGLPELDRWLAFLEKKNVDTRAYPTGYLHAWLGMMLLKHLLLRTDRRNTAQQLVDSYYNRYFFATERRNPAYRHLIVAEKTGGVLDTVDQAIVPTIMPDMDDSSAGWGVSVTPTMLALVQRQLAMLGEQQAQEAAAREQVHQATVAAQQTIAQLQTQLAAAQAESANKDAQLAAALAEASNAYPDLAAAREQLRVQAEQHDALIHEQREQVRHYRQQVSMLERILADQQISSNRHNDALIYVHAQVAEARLHAQQQATQYEVALRDLTERAGWLEKQALMARHELDAVKRGRVLRLLNHFSRRMKS
jgi:hypothetical protein